MYLGDVCKCTVNSKYITCTSELNTMLEFQLLLEFSNCKYGSPSTFFGNSSIEIAVFKRMERVKCTFTTRKMTVYGVKIYIRPLNYPPKTEQITVCYFKTSWGS